MSGWTKTVSQYHHDLKLAMQSYRGKQLRTSEINEIIINTPNLAPNAQLIQPSDHCINHTNNGACLCALSGEAVFEQQQRGFFNVRNIA
jgi:hypothetical protein